MDTSSEYAASTETHTWKTGWYNGIPAVIRAVGVTETQIVLDNGTVAETNVRGIKGLGALRKLPGWSETAPVPVVEEVVETSSSAWVVEYEPGMQPEPAEATPPAEEWLPTGQLFSDEELSDVQLPPDQRTWLNERAPDVSLLTTIADVARAIADEVAGLARPDVVSALKVRAGEIALGGVRVRTPKVERVETASAPRKVTEGGWAARVAEIGPTLLTPEDGAAIGMPASAFKFAGGWSPNGGGLTKKLAPHGLRGFLRGGKVHIVPV